MAGGGELRELRVHGIGGTSASAVLGEAADAALVPVWPLREGTGTWVWRGDDRSTGVYRWADLTSGSRWYALWPLALPFVLLNAGGFMLPRGRIGRVLRPVHHLLCAACTVWVTCWVLLATELLLDQRWQRIAAVAGILLAIVGPAHWQHVWRGQREEPAHGAISIGAPGFFAEGRLGWSFHLGLVLAVLAARWRQPSWFADGAAVCRVGVVCFWLVVPLMVAGLLLALGRCACRRARWHWALVGPGTIGFGVLLIGGLTLALLRARLPAKEQHLAPFVLFDVMGWALLVGLAVLVLAIGLVLGRPSAVEALRTSDEPPRSLGRILLPEPVGRIRSRLAHLPDSLPWALAAVIVTFLVLAPLAWHVRVDGAATLHTAGSCRVEVLCRSASDVLGSPAAKIAQLVLYGIVSWAAIALIRTRASKSSLRNIGSVWDVLAFWPRRYHPFAVRPYSTCAVAQLRELLTDDGSPLAPGGTVLAHSQGTVLVAAALAGCEPGTVRPSRIVTVGSPLRSLYSAAFEAHVGPDLFADVVRALGDGTWTNAWHGTDHVGRTVAGPEGTWVPDDVDDADALATGRWSGHAGAAGGPSIREVALRDPIAPQAPVQGHNGYWTDPRLRSLTEGG